MKSNKMKPKNLKEIRPSIEYREGYKAGQRDERQRILGLIEKEGKKWGVPSFCKNLKKQIQGMEGGGE